MYRQIRLPKSALLPHVLFNVCFELSLCGFVFMRQKICVGLQNNAERLACKGSLLSLNVAYMQNIFLSMQH